MTFLNHRSPTGTYNSATGLLTKSPRAKNRRANDFNLYLLEVWLDMNFEFHAMNKQELN